MFEKGRKTTRLRCELIYGPETGRHGDLWGRLATSIWTMRSRAAADKRGRSGGHADLVGSGKVRRPHQMQSATNTESNMTAITQLSLWALNRKGHGSTMRTCLRCSSPAAGKDKYLGSRESGNSAGPQYHESVLEEPVYGEPGRVVVVQFREMSMILSEFSTRWTSLWDDRGLRGELSANFSGGLT